MARENDDVLTMPWIPTPSDGLDASETLRTQYETEQSISSLLTEHLSSTAVSSLALATHVAYCRRLVDHPLPPYFIGLDASRPWVLYWTTHSLALMGHELDEVTQSRLATTLAAFQNEDGGFGGGPGQLSHLAPSYAALCALAYAGPDGWRTIDRPAMYSFLLSLKQRDGSFIMHHGGEVDVRGCYCALTIATLLNILTPEILEGTAAFVASCQTYEGGLAAAAEIFAGSAPVRSAPLGEAHGGYAFCAAASYLMCTSVSPTGASLRSPGTAQTLDVPALLRWAVSMQANPIEGGGFRGRTNKLVDGCYSWWCGGILPLAECLLAEEMGAPPAADLYDRASLRQYVTLIAQAPSGGLRDKPGKSPDAYHTCYNLSGSSSAQQRPVFSATRRKQYAEAFVEKTSATTDSAAHDGSAVAHTEAVELAQKAYSTSLAWESTETPSSASIPDKGDMQLIFAHPVFNICMSQVQAMMAFFYGQVDQ